VSTGAIAAVFFIDCDTKFILLLINKPEQPAIRQIEISFPDFHNVLMFFLTEV
jgi:hypothetical protein